VTSNGVEKLSRGMFNDVVVNARLDAIDKRKAGGARRIDAFMRPGECCSCSPCDSNQD